MAPILPIAISARGIVHLALRATSRAQLVLRHKNIAKGLRDYIVKKSILYELNKR